MDCLTCKQSLLPENPTVRMLNRRTGKYHVALCEGCRSPSKEKEHYYIDQQSIYYRDSLYNRGEGYTRTHARAFEDLVNEVSDLRKLILDKKVIVKREYIQYVPREKDGF